MLIGEKGRKYGLEVRAPPGSKPAAPSAKRRSVFGEDDDEDETVDNVEQQIARQAARKQSDKKVADMHAAALAEDAAIFDYDSHYDSIQESRAQPKRQEKLQRQSRYIAGLLEKAEERKQEQDILYERQLAKERAAEDHLFGDKEKFVTAAYRAKLAERQAWLAERKRKEEEEQANAVEKRGHMGDFYRNLLRSNVAFGGKPGEAAAKPRQAAQQAEQPAGKAEKTAAAQGEEEGEEEPRWLPLSPQHAAERGQEDELGAQQPAAEAAAAPSAAQRQQDEQQGGAAGGPAAVEARAAGQGSEHAGGEAGAGTPAAPAAAAGQRRNQEDAVAAARERYLARKRQRTGS
ncbi:hypothetical protein ABPG75_002397 [Micractinium tetrahymenae]